jgi:predicted metal-dependent phosphoesterase TrpH
MPAGAPFTRLCQSAIPTAPTGRADLHIHSTASDGLYTPTQVVDVARRTGLAAIALTDHDTLAGLSEARSAAGPRLEVIAGVELSCEWQQREVHVLGYFVDCDNKNLATELARVQQSRVERFSEMTARLRQLGVKMPNGHGPTRQPAAIGRRHLAHHLVSIGAVDSVREAFSRYIDDGKPAFVPKLLLPIGRAIELVRAAGGVSSYAHPGNELDARGLAELAEIGLNAVEAEYPTLKNSRKAQLRGWAQDLHLAVTGGSDCHGPDELKRAIGRCTITASELAALRGQLDRSSKMGAHAHALSSESFND